MPLVDTSMEMTLRTNNLLRVQFHTFFGCGKVSFFSLCRGITHAPFPGFASYFSSSYNWTAFLSQSLYSSSLLTDSVRFSGWVTIVPIVGKDSAYSCQIGGWAVDRHARTLSLEAGDASDGGQTEYSWATSFLVVGITMRETPPRSFIPRRWAGS